MEQKTKAACDGRTLTLAPDVVVDYFEACSECLGLPTCVGHPYDRNEPGGHQPRPSAPPGVDVFVWISSHGHTCSWCGVYRQSFMEAAAENVTKPSQLLEYFKRRRS